MRLNLLLSTALTLCFAISPLYSEPEIPESFETEFALPASLFADQPVSVYLTGKFNSDSTDKFLMELQGEEYVITLIIPDDTYGFIYTAEYADGTETTHLDPNWPVYRFQRNYQPENISQIISGQHNIPADHEKFEIANNLILPATKVDIESNLSSWQSYKVPMKYNENLDVWEAWIVNQRPINYAYFTNHKRVLESPNLENKIEIVSFGIDHFNFRPPLQELRYPEDYSSAEISDFLESIDFNPIEWRKFALLSIDYRNQGEYAKSLILTEALKNSREDKDNPYFYFEYLDALTHRWYYKLDKVLELDWENAIENLHLQLPNLLLDEVAYAMISMNATPENMSIVAEIIDAIVPNVECTSHKLVMHTTKLNGFRMINNFEMVLQTMEEISSYVDEIDLSIIQNKIIMMENYHTRARALFYLAHLNEAYDQFIMLKNLDWDIEYMFHAYADEYINSIEIILQNQGD